ncbi:MAG: hypothetical protein GVY02_01825 [Bacteroidetes bacterium]|jgi:hypothetical protein|nr:hypothetical protein [Bacteroidota bacterium]
MKTVGASGLIIGNIITGGDIVLIDGNGDNYSRLLYAPNADVSMGGSGKIKGSLVAKSFTGSGGFTVTYLTDFEDTLPDLDSGDGGGGRLPSQLVTGINGVKEPCLPVRFF